jgi:hypothetical protein
MFTNSLRWGGLLLFLAVSGGMGQERSEDQKAGPAKAENRVERRANAQHRGGRVPSPEYLTEELKLDQEQESAVRRIFEENGKKMDELREEFRPPPEMSERLAELRTAMWEARQAGDQDRLQEIRNEMRTIQEELRKKRAPMRERREAARKEFYDNLLAVMPEGQKTRFEELWQEWTEPRMFGGPWRSPQALRKVVEKLPDLTEEQQQKVEELFVQYKEAARDLERNSPARRKLTKRLYDDVVGLLNAEQKETVEKKLRGRGGPGAREWRGRGLEGRGGQDRPDHPEDKEPSPEP